MRTRKGFLVGAPGFTGGSGRFALAILLLVLAAQAQAQWIRATGQAAVIYGDRERALSEARDNALQEAALRLQAQIASTDTVENGVLTHSHLTVNSRAQARELRIVSERVEGGRAWVTVEADMVEDGVCKDSSGYNLRKRVAVAGFALALQRDADLGRLYDAERALPEFLYQRLLGTSTIEPFSISQRQLYDDLGNTPSISEADNRVHKTLALARDLDVQFVVAGVIRDLDPVDASAWGTSALAGWKRGLGLGNRNRRFVMDLMVHDGFSGSPVMERRYQTVGIWNADREAETGFLTPAFMATSYGQAVAGMLEQAAADISAELQCQPFMARISRVDDRQVYLATGAASGLRPGQALRIYRRFEFLDRPGGHYELQPTQTTLRLDQVYPQFSRGQISVPAGNRNIQQDDIAIIW